MALRNGSVPQDSVYEPCETDKVCPHKNWDDASLLGNHEGLPADYRVKDSNGQDIEHLLVNAFLIAYWVDHPVCLVMIVDVEAVR